jgi:CRISPR-associated protein Csc1
MEIYRYSLQFEDYVFYATTERGKVFETGWFIHNYALTYALGLALSNYREEIQKPDYANQFVPVNNAGIYVTPAQVLDSTCYCINQFNTMDETFSLSRGQSLGYPAWGFAKMFRPLKQKTVNLKPNQFTNNANGQGYLICQNSLSNSLAQLSEHYQTEINLFPCQYIRLGKFMAKVKFILEKAISVNLVNQSQVINTMLNWSDLSDKPQLFDLIASALPTRLLQNAKYLTSTNLLQAKFNNQAEFVYLPTNMTYLATT